MNRPPQQCQLCARLTAYTATVGEDRVRVCGVCLDRIEREHDATDKSSGLMLQRVDGTTEGT